MLWFEEFKDGRERNMAWHVQTKLFLPFPPGFEVTGISADGHEKQYVEELLLNSAEKDSSIEEILMKFAAERMIEIPVPSPAGNLLLKHFFQGE